MSRRAPTSSPTSRRVVSKGRIRVDAAKAMAKLREHLLVDLHDYALEIVRAAVASDAQAIDVSFDANEVRITWLGHPIANRTLVQLLDHVLTEAEAGEAQRLRLLALGVNAALGLEPAHVEIYSVSAGGKRCTRVRWVPEMLRAADDEGLRPEPETVPRPEGMEAGAMRVVVKRRVGWTVLRRAAFGGAPKEVFAIAQATEDLAVALTLNAEAWERPDRPAVVARFPLELPEEVVDTVRYAVLEVLDLSEAIGSYEPAIVMLEQGVRLVQYGFEPEGFPFARYAGLTLPVRVVVDAEALPTNASRSEVREDSPLYAATISASRSAFELAVKTLCDVSSSIGEAPSTVWLSEDAAARENALAALVCVAAGARRAKATLPSLAHRVIRQRLFLDACGKPQSFITLEPREGQSLIVYEGDDALEESLAPWLRNVMWRSGRLVERVMRGVHTVDAEHLVKDAREKRARRDAFMDRDVVDVAVPASPHHLVREAFEVKEGEYVGLGGEVAVKAPSGAREGSTIRLFHLGREIAILSEPAKAYPLPVDIALRWDRRIRARDTYDGIEVDDGYRRALWYAMRVAVLAVAELADKLDEDVSADVRHRLCAAVRRAFGTAMVGHESAEMGADEAIALADDSALLRAEAWPSTNGFTSLVAVRSTIAERGGYFVAASTSRGRAVDGRPVLAVDERERSWLARFFGDGVEVPYDRGLVSPAEEGALLDRRRGYLETLVETALVEQGVMRAPMMSFQREGVLGLVAPAAESRLMLCHVGSCLSRSPHATSFGAVVMAIDDEGVTPNAAWDGVQSSVAPWSTEEVERELLATCVAALAGDQASQRKLGLRRSDDAALRPYLLSSAKALETRLASLEERAGADEEEGAALSDLYERLASMPLLTMADEAGKPRAVSIAEVEAAHPSPAPVPMLREAPYFPTFEWRPLVVSMQEEGVVRKWLGARMVAAEGQLSRRREIAVRESYRSALLERDEQQPWELGGLGAHQPKVHRYEAEGVSVAVALPASRIRRDEAVVDLMLDRRPVGRFQLEALPVVARVGITDASWLDARLGRLGAVGGQQVIDHVNRAAAELAVMLLDRKVKKGDPASMTHPALVRLCAALVEHGAAEPSKRAFRRALRYKGRWPKVQGGHTSLGVCVKQGDEVEYGTELFSPWVTSQRKSRLDDPILYLPPNELGGDLRTILGLFDFTLRNMNSALAKLQARRSGVQERSVPALAGEPLHPAMRSTVAALRLRGFDGEVEIVDGGDSSVTATDLDGVRLLDFDAGCAVRAAILFEAPRSHAADEDMKMKLRKAVSLMLANVATKLDEMPVWVRDAYRAHLVHKLFGQHDLYKRDERASVFVDTAGGWHSLQELGQQRSVWVTTLSPPFSAHDFAQPILTVDAVGAAALETRLSVVDKTPLVARAREALARRSADPLARIAIPSDVRARCARVCRVQEEEIRGEVGLLQPAHGDHAGLFLHAGGRPLCQLESPGWPMVAMLDADLEPNAFFDGLADPKQALALLERVKAIATDLIAEHTRSPADALAAHPIAAESGEPVVVGGCFWLPAAFVESPEVSVEVVSGEHGRRQEVTLRTLPAPSARVSGTIPVAGHVLVMAGPGLNLHDVLAKQATLALTEMLLGLAEEPPSPLLDAYRWNAALLGVRAGGRIVAATTDGEIGERAVVVELEKGKVWWTAQRGSAEGVFPGEPPPFILQDEPGSALMRVLRMRAPQALEELGGWVVEPESAPSARPARVEAIASRPTAPSPRREPPPRPERVRGEEAIVEDSWLAGLTRRVVALFWDVPPPAPASHGFGEAVKETIEGLELPAGVVTGVVFTRSGRPIRWRSKDRRILVHRDHESVLALVPADVEEPTDRALVALAAAAMSELNRAHGQVSSAEEKHALLLLMESLS